MSKFKTGDVVIICFGVGDHVVTRSGKKFDLQPAIVVDADIRQGEMGYGCDIFDPAAGAIQLHWFKQEHILGPFDPKKLKHKI